MRTTKSNGRADLSIWQRVTQFHQRPSATAARALLTLQFSDHDRTRMRELAAKARSGNLTADEEAEADTYEQIASLLGILHSQARRALKRPQAAS